MMLLWDRHLEKEITLFDEKGCGVGDNGKNGKNGMCNDNHAFQSMFQALWLRLLTTVKYGVVLCGNIVGLFSLGEPSLSCAALDIKSNGGKCRLLNLLSNNQID